ncbi:aspartyl/asparaginyl beta-hydroxylase domain-containing protein [Azospirillum thermophilum]|uniref:Aspartyl/asparaginy/proline hydroxylase domain-containing protein n=1 Tax=Azospirillum thermophilum TaxID=2202148 RepID=A0A2S2CKU2_9PROT|nr:aspartyl/asparaginyl beta-hydroxylase domain-containing protein [Azospirillum thermophilum]AWK85092.1 hypothetical protein DEW08_01855 [Azospirillum thermophilum]
MESFRRVTEGSGLVLHAPAALRLDAGALQAEYAALDAALPEGERGHFGAGSGSGWTSVPLFDGRDPCPAAAFMPSVGALLAARTEWPVRRAHLLRQPPGGSLAWHYDNQALHRAETRLLIPIHQPPGAVTLIGHESAAYPEGQCWTGDFCFPHQVENPAARERIVLVVDVLSVPPVAALFPPVLSAELALRERLASEAVGLLLSSRARSAA